jgi:hypothetical protein
MKPLAKQIVTFLFLVFLFSSLPYFLIIHSHHVGRDTGSSLIKAASLFGS